MWWRFRSLITDVDGYISIGRLSFWIVFGIIIFHWSRSSAPDATLMTAFMALLGYEVLKKGRDLLTYRTSDHEITIMGDSDE